MPRKPKPIVRCLKSPYFNRLEGQELEVIGAVYENGDSGSYFITVKHGNAGYNLNSKWCELLSGTITPKPKDETRPHITRAGSLAQNIRMARASRAEARIAGRRGKSMY